MKKIILSLLLVLSGSVVFASLPDTMIVFTPEDEDIFNDYVLKFNSRKHLPINDLLMETGFYFLETPYVNYTLEVAKPQEKLIVNLRELDCTTFTETCLALVRTLKSEDITFQTYMDQLQKIRYRNGELNEFPSRLHYFSEWIYDNDRMGIARNVTREVGGVDYPVYFSLMTRVAKNYPQLSNADYLKQIGEIEKEISNRAYHYVPKDKLDPSLIKDGDIIAMTTPGKGIGIMHMGIAVHINGQLYFMHASSTGKRVMITDFPFREYSAAIKSNTGYMVLRPVEPVN